MLTLAAGILGYIVGCVPSALIISARLSRSDPRLVGSGNPGAMNVLRNVGVIPGLLTAAADVLKGYAAVKSGLLIGPCGWTAGWVAGVMAVAGHNWPFLGRLRGGKGVAVSVGAYFALAPRALIALTALAAGASTLTRDPYSGVVGGYWMLVPAFAAPATRMLLLPGWRTGPAQGLAWAAYAASIAALLTVRFAPDCRPYWRDSRRRGSA